MIPNNTFVVQGEHRLYEPDGNSSGWQLPIQPTRGRAQGRRRRRSRRHRLFDMRGHDGVFYEVLDDNQNVIGTLVLLRQ